MIINPQKCKFGVTSVEFLGWQSFSPRQVQAIRDFPQPTTRRQLRAFLGLINFYYRFIPNCAQILHPLNAFLSSTPLPWDETSSTAFNTIKDALASTTLLIHPQTTCPNKCHGLCFGCTSRCSTTTVCRWSIFSKKQNPAESRYSTFDHELLKHFRISSKNEYSTKSRITSH